MKRAVLAIGLFASAFVPLAAQAKCYHYDNAPSDVYVCVGKDGRDDFADRDKGQKICSDKSGTHCGPVGSSSSSCHSNAGKCYDENGNASSDLSGY